MIFGVKHKYTFWSDQRLHSELLPICAATGRFPSNSELVQIGRGDIASAIGKRGGFVFWSNKLGYDRKASESETGWDGEIECAKILTDSGYECNRPTGVKNPYDLVIDGFTRVDVKTAKYAEYGVCRGWFYRIGKHQSADLVMLFQSDTKEFYMIPWFLCPTTNITIARDGGKYAAFRNNFEVLDKFSESRLKESSWSRLIIKK